MASIGAVTAEALAEIQRCGIASARAQLAAAERARLLRGRRPLAAVAPLYTITRTGLRACGLRGLEPCRVSAANALHLSTCARAAAHLAGAYPDRRVAGECELRRDERARGRPLASACLRVGPDGQQLLHRPDLVLWPAGPSGTVDAGSSQLPVAVEVELTVKAPRRLLEICRAWARCRIVDGVITSRRQASSARWRAHWSRCRPAGTSWSCRCRRSNRQVTPRRPTAAAENRRRRTVCSFAGIKHAKRRPAIMSSFNVNRVVLVGRLTRDPELRALPSGSNVCSLRLACNSSRRETDGTYTERPNYFDVSVYGAAGDSVGRYMGKGRRLAVDGRLEWREWETGGPAETTGREHRRRDRSIPGRSERSRAVGGAGWDGESGDDNGSAPADSHELVGRCGGRRDGAHVLIGARRGAPPGRGQSPPAETLQLASAGLWASLAFGPWARPRCDCADRLVSGRRRWRKLAGARWLRSRPGCRLMPVNTQAVGRRTLSPGLYAVGREKVRESLAVGETDPRYLDVQAARAAGYADVVAPPMFAVVCGVPALGPAIFDPDGGRSTSR